ncbi:MAG: hypothetical protein QMD46_11605 [Methanomicrobiales archaeon]|nr:hypothetical protein [Methanomicrobiales archaeon]
MTCPIVLCHPALAAQKAERRSGCRIDTSSLSGRGEAERACGRGRLSDVGFACARTRRARRHHPRLWKGEVQDGTRYTAINARIFDLPDIPPSVEAVKQKPEEADVPLLGREGRPCRLEFCIC